MVKKKEKESKEKKDKFIISKKILKPATQMTVKIKDEAESIWDDTNRFFKGEMEEAKRTMFF